MKRRLILCLLLPCAGALADARSDVRCHEIAFSNAAETRDADAFAALIDRDARFVGQTVLHGPQAIAEGWSIFFATDGPTIKWRPQFVEVLDDGSLALTRGPYRMISIDENGQSIERWGTFNSVWRRQPDGGWKVVFDAGSASAEAPAAETRALLDQRDDCGD